MRDSSAFNDSALADIELSHHGRRRNPSRVRKTSKPSTLRYSMPYLKIKKLDWPISGVRFIHDIGIAVTLKPIKMGFNPVSALTANHDDSRFSLSTMFRFNSFRLFVRSLNF